MQNGHLLQQNNFQQNHNIQQNIQQNIQHNIQQNLQQNYQQNIQHIQHNLPTNSFTTNPLSNPTNTFLPTIPNSPILTTCYINQNTLSNGFITQTFNNVPVSSNSS